MSWNYSNNPAASVKDAVRFEIQDTNPDAQLMQDEEIRYAISWEATGTPPSQGEVLSAAAHCMEALARLFAAQADESIGELSFKYSKQAEGYDKQAVKLRLRAQGMHAPWAGGMSLSEKEALDEQPDRAQPAFKREQFDSPYVHAPSIHTQVTQGEEGD